MRNELWMTNENGDVRIVEIPPASYNQTKTEARGIVSDTQKIEGIKIKSAIIVFSADQSRLQIRGEKF